MSYECRECRQPLNHAHSSTCLLSTNTYRGGNLVDASQVVCKYCGRSTTMLHADGCPSMRASNGYSGMNHVYAGEVGHPNHLCHDFPHMKMGDKHRYISHPRLSDVHLPMTDFTSPNRNGTMHSTPTTVEHGYPIVKLSVPGDIRVYNKMCADVKAIEESLMGLAENAIHHIEALMYHQLPQDDGRNVRAIASRIIKIGTALVDDAIERRADTCVMYDKDLIEIDPYDPELTEDMKQKIIDECKINSYYFAKKVVRLKALEGAEGKDGYSYDLIQLTMLNDLKDNFCNYIETRRVGIMTKYECAECGIVEHKFHNRECSHSNNADIKSSKHNIITRDIANIYVVCSECKRPYGLGHNIDCSSYIEGNNEPKNHRSLSFYEQVIARESVTSDKHLDSKHQLAVVTEFKNLLAPMLDKHIDTIDVIKALKEAYETVAGKPIEVAIHMEEVIISDE